eukprot:4049387-Prymnesium_polylepis.1
MNKKRIERYITAYNNENRSLYKMGPGLGGLPAVPDDDDDDDDDEGASPPAPANATARAQRQGSGSNSKSGQRRGRASKRTQRSRIHALPRVP